MGEFMSIRDSRSYQIKDEASLISRDEVDQIIQETGFTKFGQIQDLVSSRTGKIIGYSERKIISDALRGAYCSAAELQRAADDNGNRGILLFTAYTEDYTIGKLCDLVNSEYAKKNGYQYLSKVLSYDDMLQAIGPKKNHCTWFKVFMLRKFLTDEADMLMKNKIQYIMWIDADAVIINDKIRIEGIIDRGRNRDLIIAENMHSGCLLNAGVMLVRLSEWSKELWQDVWDCNKYDSVTFYEQSALIRRLRARREGLEMLEENCPFHSYLPGGAKGVKLFAHVAVLPHLELNTNSGWLCEGRQIERSRSRRLEKAIGRLRRQEKVKQGAALANDGDTVFTSPSGETYSSLTAFHINERKVYESYLKGEEMPHFIFHAAGHCGKLVSLRGVLLKMGIPVPEEFLSLDSFSIPKGVRSTLGVETITESKGLEAMNISTSLNNPSEQKSN